MLKVNFLINLPIVHPGGGYFLEKVTGALTLTCPSFIQGGYFLEKVTGALTFFRSHFSTFLSA